jgi:outer membrane protein TolC
MKISLLAFTLLIAGFAGAQVSRTDLANRPDTVPHDAIGKALAEIAVENVNNGVGVQEAAAKSSEYNYRAQRTAWIDNFRASGNLNSFNNSRINDLSVGQAFYPRYNIGVTLPLGIFVNQPKQTKVQYYRYQSDLESVKLAKQNLRLEVITRYYNYVRTQKLFELQEEVLQDVEFATSKTEEKFGKGEVTLDAYTAASARYNAERGQKVNLERDLMVARAELEMMLGMPLEAAISRTRTSLRLPGGQRR